MFRVDKGSKDSGDWKVVILLVISIPVVLAYTNSFRVSEKCPSAEVVGGILGGGNMIVVENRKCTYYEKGIVGLCLGGRVVFNSQVSEHKPIARIAGYLSHKVAC